MTAAERVDRHFRLIYRRSLDEYEISDIPGYWRLREPCTRCAPPAREHRHTASYYDDSKDPASGQFVSPYQTWRELRQSVTPATQEAK